MAKIPTKTSTTKKYDLSSFKKEMGIEDMAIKEKELSWYKFNDAFYDAVKLPGIPRGYASQFIGFSDTGKSTGIYESIIAAMRVGDFPIIVDTEGSWSWTHARDMGMQFEEVVDKSTGEIVDYRGDFIFLQGKELLAMYGDFDYKSNTKKSKPQRFEPVIEDVAKVFNHFADLQLSGELDRSLLFVWDSVGSINCYQSAISDSANNQWNAGALNASFQSLLGYKLPSTRREDYPHTITMVSVNKVWLNNLGGAQPTMKQKGGEGFRYHNRLIFLMGGKLTSSARKVVATAGGETYAFGVQSKIEVVKNQVNGVESKGEVCSTPHGFVNPDKLTEYKSKHKDYLLSKLGTAADSVIEVVITDDVEDDSE